MATTEGQFLTDRRLHLGLAITELDASIRFYETLFGEPPIKVREGYAKFEPADPSVNLSLNVVERAAKPHPTGHFGIQVKTADEVKVATERLAAAGLATDVEEATACCYAVQDKVWVTDPDGHRWEVFVVLDPDSPHRSPRTAKSDCCDEEPGCCDEPAGCCG